MTTKRNKKNTSLLVFAGVLLILIAIFTVLVVQIIITDKDIDIESNSPSTFSELKVPDSFITPSNDSSEDENYSSEPQGVTKQDTLDANYSNLLLVNGENPLPGNYDYGGNLYTVDDKYINGSLKQVDKNVWPYMKAMIEAAWKDGVQLYIWSPYRSYDTQNMLFEKQVKRNIDKGFSREAAEIEAATVVARPGTSEHHTGLAADFNMASDAFETTKMFKWLTENAADYGFIMRYSAEKQQITGVIYESWHWRFVGINAAREINDLGMCLEEYVEYINNN